MKGNYTEISFHSGDGKHLGSIKPDQLDDLVDMAKKVGGQVSEALETFPLPDKEDFNGQQFKNAPELKRVGEFLIDKYENDFAHLHDANIVYLWKEKGGKSGGMATLGKCIRPTGLTEFCACAPKPEDIEAARICEIAPPPADKVDYIVWAAADHLRLNSASVRTVHALIFHELCHTHWDDGKLVVKSHEFEGFAREIEEFGMWTTAIKKIAEACETVKDVQQGLFTNIEG